MIVGVVALQGAVIEHINMLKRISSKAESAVEIKTPEDLARCSPDALILPGGESTTIGMMAQQSGLLQPLQKWVADGKPIWGTCAGMILLCNSATGTKQGGQPLIGGLNATVKRNAFGTQADSFVEMLKISVLRDPEEQFQGIFIRAPVIEAASHLEVLATCRNGQVVAVRQNNIIATAFHPELTKDVRFHDFFLQFAQNCIEASNH